MKLEVGMYVRTILGISKLIEIKDDSIYIFDKLDEDLWSDDIADEIWEYELEEVVIKASYNIIDILEVGDYVNGYIVEEIKRGYDGKIWIDNGTRGYDEGGEYTIWKRNEDIKSVITHEQIEQMTYRIGE